jgi:hypothetical protein
MTDLLLFVPYVILLALSPLIGRICLRFVYPDIRTLISAKQWMMYVAFGLIIYLPAAFIGLFELITPFYNSSYVFIEYEGNIAASLSIYCVAVIMSTSIVEYARRKKKKTKVGLPRKFIRYGIQQELKRENEKRREWSESRKKKDDIDIKKITRSLEETAKQTLKDDTRLNSTIRELKQSLETEKMAKEIEKDAILKRLQEQINEVKRKDIKEEGSIKPETDEIDQKFAVLQHKIKAQKLYNKIEELKEAREKEYSDEDVEAITEALRSLKKEKEDAGKHGHRKHDEPTEEDEGEEEPIIQLEEPRHHQRKQEVDIFRDVVGDVRSQMKDDESESPKKEPSGEKSWYTGKETAPPSDDLGLGESDDNNIEFLESGLSFGDEGLGMDDELGEFGDLEDLDESVGSSDYDGMFVDAEPSDGCPNCGKKGTDIVYCSNCGKPMCSNCAKDVKAQKDFISYTCPHCETVFAMKRKN